MSDDASFTKIKYVTILLFLGAILLPKVVPLGLPVAISDKTRETFTYMESIEEGSIILINWDVCPGGELPIGYPLVDLITHGMEKNLKFVAFGTVQPATGPLGQEVFMKWVDWGDYKYGEDYVYIGFLPGLETAMAAVATDFKGIVKEDIFGSSIDKLPLLQQIDDYKDLGAVILATDWSHMPAAYSRQWDKEGLLTIAIAHSGLLPDLLPYYPTAINAIMLGTSSAAEYEYLLGKPGKAIVATDVLSSAQIMIIIFGIGSNILPLLSQSKKGEN